MKELTKMYNLDIILRRFLIGAHPKLVDIYHLTPDWDCFILESKKGKLALIKTDHYDDESCEIANLESVGIKFIQWLKPKKPNEERTPFTEFEGNYYALALVE